MAQDGRKLLGFVVVFHACVNLFHAGYSCMGLYVL